MMFIGGLRAKLGIGKHKADKHVADTLAKAIKEAENFTVEIGKVAVGSAVLVAQGIGKGVVAAKEGIDTAKEAVVNGIDNAKQSVVNGISNVKQSVSEHCTAQKAKIIAKLENHINKRIASEKQKTKDIMQKMNPDAGERE